MIYLALQIASAAMLVILASVITPNDNLMSKLMFRAVPLCLGFGMSFFILARFMGWPV